MMMFLATIASAVTIMVNDDAPNQSIQAVVDASCAGDVIQVAAGIYVEHVEISKNISLIGAGADVTRIEFSGDNSTVLVTNAAEVSIEGFTISYISS